MAVKMLRVMSCILLLFPLRISPAQQALKLSKLIQPASVLANSYQVALKCAFEEITALGIGECAVLAVNEGVSVYDYRSDTKICRLCFGGPSQDTTFIELNNQSSYYVVGE